MERQKSLVLIRAKHLAESVTTPMFLADSDGNLIFYNEPAEKILGHRYEETGRMTLEEWGTLFSATDSLGRALAPEDLPLARALTERKPSQGSLFIRGVDGVPRHLAVTAVPLEGPGGANLGALAIFWAVPLR
jgi:PAS domain-containing protein